MSEISGNHRECSLYANEKLAMIVNHATVTLDWTRVMPADIPLRLTRCYAAVPERRLDLRTYIAPLKAQASLPPEVAA